MNEDDWLRIFQYIVIAVILLFIGVVAYSLIWKPNLGGDTYTEPDMRSTIEKQCEAAGGIYTTGFFSEGCTFPPKNTK